MVAGCFVSLVWVKRLLKHRRSPTRGLKRSAGTMFITELTLATGPSSVAVRMASVRAERDDWASLILAVSCWPVRWPAGRRFYTRVAVAAGIHIAPPGHHPA